MTNESNSKNQETVIKSSNVCKNNSTIMYIEIISLYPTTFKLFAYRANTNIFYIDDANSRNLWGETSIFWIRTSSLNMTGHFL